MNNEAIGRRIRSIRMKLGMTTDKFAKEFKVKPPSKGTVSKWENGHYLPNNERLKRIAELGGITVDELLYGYNEELLVQAKLDKWDSNSKKVLLNYLENDLENATPEESLTLAKYIDLLKTYSDNPQFIGYFQSLFNLFIDLKEEIEQANDDEVESITIEFKDTVQNMIKRIRKYK